MGASHWKRSTAGYARAPVRVHASAKKKCLLVERRPLTQRRRPCATSVNGLGRCVRVCGCASAGARCGVQLLEKLKIRPPDPNMVNEYLRHIAISFNVDYIGSASEELPVCADPGAVPAHGVRRILTPVGPVPLQRPGGGWAGRGQVDDAFGGGAASGAAGGGSSGSNLASRFTPLPEVALPQPGSGGPRPPPPSGGVGGPGGGDFATPNSYRPAVPSASGPQQHHVPTTGQPLPYPQGQAAHPQPPSDAVSDMFPSVPVGPPTSRPGGGGNGSSRGGGGGGGGGGGSDEADEAQVMDDLSRRLEALRGRVNNA